METKYIVNLSAALIPLVIGFIWYHPKVLGSFLKSGNGGQPQQGHAWWIYPLTFVCGYYIAGSLGAIVIHQRGLLSMLADQPDVHVAGTQLNTTVQGLLDKYGDHYRTFKHGALHGSMTGIFLILPILAVITLFEKKKWTYLAIHGVYWIICLALMGGVVCAYMPIQFQLIK